MGVKAFRDSAIRRGATEYVLAGSRNAAPIQNAPGEKRNRSYFHTVHMSENNYKFVRTIPI